ncbi:MAG: hypothetical protein ACD_9C00344G0001 [uncultured bacterium]|nr:MAG: hypothetical protein ACD_9C00344G0001 [uncultured bacterium]
MKKTLLISFVFSILAMTNIAHAGSPSVEIIAPIAGVKWEIGKTYTIKWKAKNVNKVGIFIYNDQNETSGSGNYVTPGGFEKIVASKGAYDWTIQANQLPTFSGDKMKSFKIQIYGYDEKDNQLVFSESKGHFSIVPEIVTPGKENFTLEQCVKIQQKMSDSRSYFWRTSEKYKMTYAELSNKIDNVIADASMKKLDISIAEGHFNDLSQVKIAKFNKDYIAFESKFIETSNLACEHPKVEFMKKLSETKILLRQVHADAVDIKSFIKEIIVPDLENLN